MRKKDISEVLKETNSSGITAQHSFGAQNRPRGRKPKNEDEKANQRVCLYLTKDEYAKLESISEQKFLGMSAQSLAKQALLKFISEQS
ncbi:MAG: ribbon-helix-helix domain-containing protein [Campylobacter sp.]|uniref:ribbon-helix-helix domain-containing protein n=1 Tax=Campylobacter sp. TaxID=205 RepID=UPI002A82923F|nr:ribbon-helix-helix domain-containing protein [Campylobacter sp.]MDY5115215.1 ribbon-helix-helix domain-containing protein [Campylobacter sp.]